MKENAVIVSRTLGRRYSGPFELSTLDGFIGWLRAKGSGHVVAEFYSEELLTCIIPLKSL